MTIYPIADIRKKVRVLLDENKELATVMSISNATLDINTIIDSVLCDAVEFVYSISPYYLLIGQVAGEDPDEHTITIPPGAKPIYAKCTEWKKGVTKFFTPDSREYLRENAGVIGVKATDLRPLAVLNGIFLELYPKGEVENIRYVEKPIIGESGSVLFSHLIYDAVCYYTAYLVCLSLNKESLFAQVAKDYIIAATL